MQCPKCQKPAADFNTSAGVTVNFCQHCKGLWFDQGEMALYCRTDSDVPAIASCLEKACPTSFPCPRCSQTLLVELPYKEGEEVRIDWCPACHGVWLDADELQEIKRIVGHTASRPAHPLEEPRVDWRRRCGLIGFGLLFVGTVLACVGNFSLLLADVLLYSLLAGLLVLPLVFTLQERYREVGAFGVVCLLFLIEAYTDGELFADALTAGMAPHLGAGLLLAGAVCSIATGSNVPSAKRLVLRLGKRQIQIKPQDEADARLLDQVMPLLAHLQAQAPESQTNPADWCAIHSCRMILHERHGQLYWSHRLDNDQECQGTVDTPPPGIPSLSGSIDARSARLDTQRARAASNSRPRAFQCPNCGHTLYNRKRSNCGFCNAVLPEDFLLSKSQIEALDKTTEEINQRHNEFMKRHKKFMDDLSSRSD